MAESNSAFSNVFQNPFSSKKDEEKSKENIPKPNEETETNPELDKDGIEIEEEEDGAIQHLIYNSFYPLTCMVHLGDDFITIKEKAPDMMKGRPNDTLLQETIKTFQSLMQEKDDEILNLRRQLKNEDSSLIKMTSEIIQTDLTLSACEEMERQLIELTDGMPEKVERIHQLQLEKTRLQESFQEATTSNDKVKITQMEEELSESLKNLLELEELNLNLSKDNEELKQSLLELNWKLEEVTDLKVEIELAKIQTEEDNLNMKEKLKDKDHLIHKLEGQLKHLDELYGVEKVIQPKKNVKTTNEIPRIEVETYDEHILELEKNLKIAQDSLKNIEENTKKKKADTGQIDDLEVSDLIEKVREKILNPSSDVTLSNSLSKIFPQYLDRFGPTDIESVDELMTIALDPKTSEKEVKDIVHVLDSIHFKENGGIDSVILMNNYNDNQRTEVKNEKAKNLLQLDVLNIGLRLKMEETLLKMEIEEVKKEYMKLETILNTLNGSYKLTPLNVLNKLSNVEIVNSILRIRSTIFGICMHHFWENIFHQPIKEKDEYKRFYIETTDQTVFKTMIFPSFINQETFEAFLLSLVNLREVLLVGEGSITKVKSNNLELMKMYGVALYHDVCSHILPHFPKEVRYLLIGRSFEEMITSDTKLLEYISLDFLSLLQDFVGKSHTDISTVLIDILLVLDFEDEIFTTISSSTRTSYSKPSSSELKISRLSTSIVTNRAENAMIRVNINKNAKNLILSKITEIQNIFNKTEDSPVSEMYRSKSEIDLIKILIEKKENLLKIIFKESFHPVIEKLLLTKESTYLSCVSKERVSLDYWSKMVLEKYNQKLVKQLNDLTINEMEICLSRLNQALKTLSPSYVVPVQNVSKDKGKLASMISRQRKMLKNNLNQCLFQKTSKLYLTQNIEEIIKQDQIYELSQDNRIKNLKEIFSIPINEKSKLEDVLRRLYDIDCEIYPGIFDQDMEKKKFPSLSESEIFDEILLLRLSVAAYVAVPYDWFPSNKIDAIDYRKQFKTLKDIESIILKVEPDVVEDCVIASEMKLLKVIVENLKKKKNIDDESLKNCFLALKKLDCGLHNTIFNAAKTLKEFENTKDNKEKKALVWDEAEDVLNTLNVNKKTKQISNSFCQDYTKIEELLGDLEDQFPNHNVKVKNAWSYMVLEKTTDILNLISMKENEETIVKSSIRDIVMNNLDDIKSWIKESSNWQRNCFNRVNNLIRKLNIKDKNRKIRMSMSDNSEISENFQYEKVAFEKAFSQLEDRFNDLVPKEEKEKVQFEGLDFEKKSDDELKSLILSLEKEISQGNWTRSDEKEATDWVNSRNRNELMKDCQNLIQKSLVLKIDSLLNKDSKKEKKTETPVKENQISQFEDEINAKLAKYEELCETVEKLKFPKQEMTQRIESSNNLLTSASPDRLRRDMISSSQQQLNYKTSYSPVLRTSSSQTQFLPTDDEDIDDYFQQRMEELQRFLKSPNTSTMNNKERITRAGKGPDVIVDGFEIEDDKTPRYYSMKLQDIQHERKEDEMGTLLHHLEKHKINLQTENDNLHQQLYISKNINENQSIRISTMEKTEDLLRGRLAALESKNSTETQNGISPEEVQIMRHERQKLVRSVATMQKRMDEFNSENISLISSNTNFQQENHNLIIKNQYLERSMKKLEDVYTDLVEQLEYWKTQAARKSSTNKDESKVFNSTEADLEKKSKQDEKDKIELVKKLDIIDQQNKLLRKHCEKMNEEISLLTKTLAEAKKKSETYLKQNHQLTELLDKMKIDKGKTDSLSTVNSLRNKDEEIKHLKNKILHLETRLVSSNESPSGERLKQELIANKDKEIMRLAEQIGTLQDRVDETRAQLEVKEYENRKLQSLTKKLQNQIDDESYFPPAGYKLVKDF